MRGVGSGADEKVRHGRGEFGLGLARIPWFVVGEDLARGRLVQVLPGWELPAHEVHALTTRGAERAERLLWDGPPHALIFPALPLDVLG